MARFSCKPHLHCLSMGLSWYVFVSQPSNGDDLRLASQHMRRCHLATLREGAALVLSFFVRLSYQVSGMLGEIEGANHSLASLGNGIIHPLVFRIRLCFSRREKSRSMPSAFEATPQHRFNYPSFSPDHAFSQSPSSSSAFTSADTIVYCASRDFHVIRFTSALHSSQKTLSLWREKNIYFPSSSKECNFRNCG